MDLLLRRSYFEKGTNGALFLHGALLCFMIELPWKENKPKISCIPEGVYEIVPRTSVKHRNHLLVRNVSNRSLILIHVANDASTQLEGCMAPVTQLTGIGKGLSSRAALEKLLSLCHQTFQRNEKVYLTIKN